MADTEELEEALGNVRHSYDDFVKGVAAISVRHGIGDQILSYISAHPSARSDDVLDFMDQLLGME